MLLKLVIHVMCMQLTYIMCICVCNDNVELRERRRRTDFNNKEELNYY